MNNLCITLIVSLVSLSSIANAQESANADLDSCVKDEQLVLTAKGAGMGLLAGLGAGLLSKDKKNAVKGAAIGAAVGGAAGFATAYFTAVGTCFKNNPSWIPESKIERTKGYAQVKKETNYNPKSGITTQVTKVTMPATVNAGAKLDIVSTFYVLTPDGSETLVKIERKLFAIVEGKETLLPFTGKEVEERTLEPGGHSDTALLPIPSAAKPDTQYRFEFNVSAGGKPVSTGSAVVTVK